MKTIDETHPPWYKESYVWFVISLPLAAVLAGFYTLYLAIDSYDGLVVDEYYKEGLAINKRLEKEDKARQYGLEAELQFNNQNKQLRLYLHSKDNFPAPEFVQVSLSHATRKGYDQILLLRPIDSYIYQTEFNDLIKGRWNIIIEADDWRLINSLRH